MYYLFWGSFSSLLILTIAVPIVYYARQASSDRRVALAQRRELLDCLRKQRDRIDQKWGSR